VAVTVITLGRCAERRFSAVQVTERQLTAIKQSSNQEIKKSRNRASVFITEEQGRTMECTESKDFGTSRKNLIKLRAKRNHLPTLWTRSFSLVPL
jgi:hypothetical protein